MNNNTTNTATDTADLSANLSGNANATAAPTASKRGRLGRLSGIAAAATATAAAFTMLAPTTSAHADAVPTPQQFEIDIDIDDSVFTPNPILPLPCYGWFCNAPVFLPDLTASSDFVPAACSSVNGVTARPHYFLIDNVGVANSGPHWTSIASPNSTILKVENKRSWRTDLTAAPVSATATTTAPFATSYLDDAWVVYDSDGTKAFNDDNYIRVWTEGCGESEIIIEANTHVGVDHLGATTPGADYRIKETTRSNNRFVERFFL